MANVFKTLTNEDVASTRTLLHEAIPITGTIASGTYNADETEENIKYYGHGMFQTVYDYPYLSSSANHIFDITCGYSNNSGLSSSTNVQNAKKINIYNQMAKILVGHDINGAILEFDRDGDIVAGGGKLREVFFINFSRLLTKDEIKKGSVSLDFYLEGSVTGGTSGQGALSSSVEISDAGAATDYRVNSPAGEYAILSASHGELSGGVGLIYYQAGIAVITASIFGISSSAAISQGGAGFSQNFGGPLSASANNGPAGQQGIVNGILTGSTIDNFGDGVRARINDIDLNNTTELNSTIYFCRANHNEFNYSSNPTYVASSKIRTKNTTTDEPVAYITSVGLYSPDNELLAVAKVSEPLKKTPSNEITLRTRLDY
jgi:hypothetical protein